jgi:hypothetical protein
MTTGWVIRVRRDAGKEGGPELEKARELLARRERLRRVQVAAGLVVRLARDEVAGDEALQRRGVSAASDGQESETNRRSHADEKEERVDESL